MSYQVVAKVSNTFGLKGEVKVISNFYGQNYQVFDQKMIVYYQSNDAFLPLTIANIREHQKLFIIKFEEINDIDQAISIKNKELFVAKKALQQINKQHLFNLLNFAVFNQENQEKIGIITNFIDNNHAGLWEITTNENKKFFLPNHNNFLEAINYELKEVRIKTIPGLIDDEKI